MKNVIIYIVICCIICGLTACNRSIHSDSSNLPIKIEIEDEGNESEKNKILIAYFSWADNTIVTDQEASIESALNHYQSVGDTGEYTDVIASTSVIPPGNVSTMASWIQEYVGGDIVSIRVEEMYPSIYDECLERASQEKADNARPELSSHVDNMEEYDVIFLGFPNWWYTAPMAIMSFIEGHDLSEKTIIPFLSHGTGGLASSIRDIKKELPDSTKVLEPLGIYRGDILTAQQTINEWLASLGFEKNSKEDTSNVELEIKKIKMTVDGQEVLVVLNDTPLANELYELLPLELNFKDFNGTEKIAYLPEGQSLNTEKSKRGLEPEIGDFGLYAPWGNLCFFYQDFHYSDDLYSIGHVESGMEILVNKGNSFTAKLEINK